MLGALVLTESRGRIWQARLCLVLAAIPLGLLLAWLYGKAIPADLPASREAVRLRNSLIAAVGSEADFAWSPDSVPASFHWERGPAPPEFVEVASRLLAGAERASNLEKALILSRHLRSRPSNGSAIGVSTVTAYHKIIDEGIGWCSDFTQVLMGLGIAAGLPLREWGVSFDGFGGRGHAVNEVYDENLRKWVFLDSYYSFFVRDAATGTPLSAREFRAYLKSGKPPAAVEIVPIVADRLGFSSPERLLAYYREGADQFFLYWGNDVFTIDSSPVVAFLQRIGAPASLRQITSIVLGIRPKLLMLPDEGGLRAARSLFALRNTFFAVMAGIVISALALLAAVRWHRRLQRAG